MTLKATVITAAPLLLVGALLVSMGTAQAQTQGILACQIQLSQFAEDVYASKGQLRPGQLAAAQQVVEVGRSQCRSSPNLVNINVQSMRQSLALDTSKHTGSQFDDFWPADQQELSLLSK